MDIIAGIHPVREALRAGRRLDRLAIARGAGGPRIQELVDLCRQQGTPVRFEPREALDRAAAKANHQGVVAFTATHAYADIDSIGEAARLVVVLDGVEDPHNLGAIARTAHAAGADALVIAERRAAGVTETVAKAAAGAIEYLPIIRAGNISRALEKLKQRGFWIYGLDERGDRLYHETDYATPSAFVLGGEGHGLHQNVRAHCDVVVRIPMAGPIASLNVSVAAGVALFEWLRRFQATPKNARTFASSAGTHNTPLPE